MSDEWSEDYNDNPPQDGPTWFISTQQLEEFRERFFALSHGKPHLTPEFVKETFDSILPGTDLFEIWQLSDMDDDGLLNESEFIAFQYLSKIRLEGYPFPNDEQFDALCLSIPPPTTVAPSFSDSALTVSDPTSFTNNNNNHSDVQIANLSTSIPTLTSSDASNLNNNLLDNNNNNNNDEFEQTQQPTDNEKELDFDKLAEELSGKSILDELFELPPIQPIPTWESLSVIHVPMMTAEDYAVFGILDEVVMRHDVAPETLKVGQIQTIQQAQEFLTEYEKVFTKYQQDLEREAQIHKNIIEKGPILHEQLKQVEQQAIQCHDYISLQFKECLLAEAQLKEAKGNLHALVHIASTPVLEKSSDHEYHHLVRERERLNRLLQLIDT